MASLLRQLVAGPRAKHAETGLDLCYVTSNIIATSGPSQTYPQRAYRNPLDQLVAFLDAQHGSDWAIWEFRAEGTGYPDEAVHGRVRHYPWPDHHPPPFRLVPMIVASMRNWLAGGDLFPSSGEEAQKESAARNDTDGDKDREGRKSKRVVVVHCKAGKGRSGTMSCSYLVSECGWKPEDALARFTERRMRPRFGAGVSIPSQLRWISYVDRWTRGGKRYVDRPVEIVEIHVWGLRHGVKVAVEGFADEGKKIKVLHTFRRDERLVVQGDAPGGGGVVDFIGDALSPRLQDGDEEIGEDADYGEIVDGSGDGKRGDDSGNGRGGSSSGTSRSRSLKGIKPAGLMRKLSLAGSKKASKKSKTIQMPEGSSSGASSLASLSAGSGGLPKPGNSTSSLHVVPDSKAQSQASLPPMNAAAAFADQDEPGGQAVIFKPRSPVVVPNSDVNVTLERRNRTPGSMGLTMVTAVAHVWFNAFFEGNGPERDGEPEESGVFEIDWGRMDGIKGSSRKGTRAADRISVVWRAVGAGAAGAGAPGKVAQDDAGRVVMTEPGEGEAVPQMAPADWKGGNEVDPAAQKQLGLRVEDPESATVSKASSIGSQEVKGPAGAAEDGKESGDEDPLKGVKTSGPSGEEELQGAKTKVPAPDDESEKGGTAQNGSIVE